MSRTAPMLLALLLSLPAAAAEALGAAGTVDHMEVNTPSADAYLQYHGRIIITSGAQVNEYRWGGTSCGTRVVPDSQVELLARALESGARVTPRWVIGQGSVKCLLGFAMRVP